MPANPQPTSVLSELAHSLKLRYDGQSFDDYSVAYHRAKYPNHTVWPSKIIPDEDLFAAGMFYCYDSRRLLRLEHFRNKRNGGSVGSPYMLDDGINFLIKVNSYNDPAYHVGHTKNDTIHVCKSNLSGFFQNLRRTGRSGYLYTTAPLEIGFRDDPMNDPHFYKHEVLAFNGNVMTEATEAADAAKAGDTTLIQESAYDLLRPYQHDAVYAIMKTLQDNGGSANMILHVGCGLGKTLIAGRVIQRIKATREPKLYVCISPILSSLISLEDRLMPFFNDGSTSTSSAVPFQSIFVYADSVGGDENDPARIGELMKKREPTVLFATYERFFGMLTDEFGEYLCDENAFLIVDDMHNMTARQCQIVNRYSTSLLMSATVPEELSGALDASVVYRYTMADGIRDGYLCDYEVIMPLTKTVRVPSTRTVVDLDIPSELTRGNMTEKALFLATGMLQTGSRRCIVYVRSSEECEQFIRQFRQVCETYHGLSPWCEKMDFTVGPRRSKEILRQFEQESDEHDLFIIASIRVMDEAVNVIRCDSEYVTYFGDTISDDHTVQRLQRGGLPDPLNPTKKNHMCIWCNTLDLAIPALCKIKKEDCDLGEKVRIMAANYHESGVTNIARRAQAQTKETVRYIDSQYLNVEALWIDIRGHLIQFIEKYGQWPMTNGNYPSEDYLARWLLFQRASKRTNILLNEQIRMLEEIPEWSWDPRETAWHKGHSTVLAFIDTHNRTPILKSQGGSNGSPAIFYGEENEVYAATWINTQRSAKRLGRLSAEQIQLLEAIPGWVWDIKEDKWAKKYAKMVEFFNTNGLRPLRQDDEDERAILKWMIRQRAAKRKGKLSDSQILRLEAVPGWTWG